MIEIVNDPEFIRDVQKGDIKLIGEWFVDHYRDGKMIYSGYEGKNLITTAGLNYILDTVLHSANYGSVTQWYVGLFKGNITPAAGDTSSSLGNASSGYYECQYSADYDNPTTRASYTPGTSSAGVISNSASKAEFTMNASITVYGAFLVSTSATNSTTGTLLAAKRFDSARSVIADDVLAVQYQITATSS